MKKAAKLITQFLIVMSLIMIFTHIGALADNLKGPFVPMGSPDERAAYDSAKIPIPADGQTADDTLEQVIMSGLSYTKAIMVVIGILMISIMGYRMVVGSDNEEEITNMRKGITYTIIALVILSMSQDIAKVFDFREGSLLQSPSEILKRVHIWDKQVEIVMTFIKYTIAAFATVMIVRSVSKLITSGAEDEETTKHKHSIFYSIAGLLLVYGGDIFIKRVFYVVNTQKYTAANGIEWGVDAGQGVREMVGLTNLIVSFAGPIAVLMIVVAAIMYLAAAGQDEKMEKAKRIIITVVVGIAIIYGAFALVNTVILGKLSTTENTLIQPME